METKSWNESANDETIARTILALEANGISAQSVANGAEAKARALELLPEGAQVMNMTSVTVDTIGLSHEILESGRYQAVRNQFKTMDRATQGLEMQQLGAGPDYTVGSVHAVTEDGKILIASATGSQLPAYAYGSQHVIWVVGSQKIVKDMDEAMKRLYEHTVPLEDARAHQAYGVGTSVNKLLMIHKEATPGRLTIIIIKEPIGF